jgi:translation initiation factor IF-3
VRLIDQNGKQIGVVLIEEALKKAGSVGLDLVEIAPKADPPVTRVIDFKKFKYEEARKERSSKRRTKQVNTKEIWLGPLMSSRDLDVRMEHARQFLKNGDRVKLTVKFGGREIVHPEFGYKILNSSLEKLSDAAEKDSEPKFTGRNLSLSVKPYRGRKDENQNKKDSNQKIQKNR